MFCTAWPEAPLTRLSITDSTTSVSESPALRRPVHGQAAHVRARAPSACRGGCRPASRRRTARARIASRTAPGSRPRVGHARVQRRLDAADHRHQVRREYQPDLASRSAGEPLADFRAVAVAGHAVRRSCRAPPRTARCSSALRPAPLHARLGVGDQVPASTTPALSSGSNAELHRGRIAAGVRDEARALDRSRFSSGRPYTASRDQLGRGVLRSCTSAPTRATSLMRKSAERSMTRAPASEQRARLAIATPFGVAKNTTSQPRRLGRRLAEGQIHAPAQAREHGRHRHAGFLARGDRAQLAPADAAASSRSSSTPV